MSARNDATAEGTLESTFFFRLLVGIGVVAYPMLAWYTSTYTPDIREFVVDKLVFGAVALCIFIASFAVKKENISTLKKFFAYALLFEVGIDMGISQEVSYLFGLFLIAALMGQYFRTRAGIIRFIVFSSLVPMVVGVVANGFAVLTGDFFVFCTFLVIPAIFVTISLSERLAIMDALVTSREQLKSIFNQSADALLVVDPANFVVVDCNDRAVTMFGLSRREELTGKILKSILDLGGDVREQAQIVHDAHELGVYETNKSFVMAGLTKARWGNIAVAELWQKGELSLLVRVADVTKRREMEEEIEKKAEELTSLNQLMTGRELRMAELKKENEELRAKITGLPS